MVTLDCPAAQGTPVAPVAPVEVTRMVRRVARDIRVEILDILVAVEPADRTVLAEGCAMVLARRSIEVLCQIL